MNLRKVLMRNLGKLVPDKLWIQVKYLKWFQKLPNLKKPETFNEKLNWLKLHDRNPEYIKMVDKYAVKEYVSNIIGEKYVIPLVGGPWTSFDEINFEALPTQFVLKTTHDCGGVIICKDKSQFDKEHARKFLSEHLKNNYYISDREWPYKNVKPQIFAEAYMEDLGTGELRDYKFFTFGGDAKIMFVATDRGKKDTETKFDFFDMDFNHLNIRNGHPNADICPEKPKSFDKMKVLAEKLSKNIPHLRVDFYEADGKLFFGELTFYHWSGLVPFEPVEWDRTLGNWIKLPTDEG